MSNAFTASGTPIPTSAPSSVDVCLITGFLINISGRPLVGVRVDFENLYDPLAVGTDTLVLQGHSNPASDADGRVQFEALRGSRIRLTVPNLHGDILFEGTVPDVATCDLLDIVLPYVVSIAWDDDPSKAATLDENFTLPLTGTLSDGTTLDVTGAVTTTSADEGIVKKLSSSTYSPIAVGSTTVSADAFDFDLLTLNQWKDNATILRFDLPATTLPADLPVTVS